MKKLISIVIPVYNEEANIRRLHARLSSALAKVEERYDLEFVFTDNHSEDMTFPLLQELAREDARVRAYRFSRNFGFQRSILSGYRLARGAAAVQIDCDLQDPPEIIPEFIRKWEEGFHVVYGIRMRRPESFFLRGCRKFFYRLLDALADEHLPHDAGDFRLVDRKVLDVVTGINDANPYLRGMIAGTGFSQTGVPYDRASRTGGESKFGFRDLVRLALDAIANHSVVPLKLASLAGVGITILSFLAAAFWLVNYVFFGDTWPRGFATLVITVLFLSGMNALFIGIIGEYVGRIYQQVKTRPAAVIEEAVEEKAALEDSRIAEINARVRG